MLNSSSPLREKPLFPQPFETLRGLRVCSGRVMTGRGAIDSHYGTRMRRKRRAAIVSPNIARASR